MNAFMTTGTYDFLKTLPKKHKNIDFYFMHGNSNVLAYYEAENKNIFAAGRAYEIFLSVGELKKKGFVVMNHIPVIEEGQPLFEEAFRNRQHGVETMPGFEAFRMLKPKKGFTYIIFTQWNSEAAYENWKNSDTFANTHKEQTIKPPAYFADRPFTTNYHMIKEDK